MTDYNDGKWHGWNGGECPVPGAEGYITYSDGARAGLGRVVPFEIFQWDQPLLFRVTKPAPPKPREVWIERDQTGRFFGVYDDKPMRVATDHTCRLYREVIE